MLSAARQLLRSSSTAPASIANNNSSTSCSSAHPAAAQHATEEMRKARFLVAIHVLYFLGTLPCLVVRKLFASGEDAEPIDEDADQAALAVWWTSLSFFPCNLIVFRMTGHLRLAVFLFLLYSQAVIIWLCGAGHPHGTEYLCFILFAVASVHVVGKTLGLCMMVVIMLEVAVLESRADITPCSKLPPNPLHTSVLRLSIVLCTCLTSLMHNYLHVDAALGLQKSMDQRMKFFALISHDLRAPLQSIHYVASDLLKTAELSSDVRTVVDVVQESSEHLLCLLNNLLELSRVQLGSLDLRIQRFNLASELDKLMRPAKVAAARKNIALRPNVHLDNCHRLGDPIRFRQVMDNLLSNAIKFTREGGYVDVNVREVGDNAEKVHVEVIDSGIGIDSEVALSLFKCFTQADTELENSHGFGLGLAICKKICQAMEGHISVESELRKGSKFWFEVRLPVHRGEAGDEDDVGSSGDEHSGECPTVEESSKSSSNQLQGKRILLVEDSKLLQMTMGRMLTHLGCAVETAWNGSEAMEVLELKTEGRPFDAILCDIHMPGLDGYHTARAIRRWELERRDLGKKSERKSESEETGHASSGEGRDCGELRMPIIGMSASMLNGEEDKCRDSGMDDFMLKPPRTEELKRCLHRWIQVIGGGERTETVRKSKKVRRWGREQARPMPPCVI